MRCHVLLLLVLLASAQRAAAEIALGALAGWTVNDEGEFVATIAAMIDYGSSAKGHLGNVMFCSPCGKAYVSPL